MAQKSKKPVKSAAKATKKAAVKAKPAHKPVKAKAVVAKSPAKLPLPKGLVTGRRPLGSASKIDLTPPDVMPKFKPLPAKELKDYKDMLLKLRDRIVDEISFLANDNLNRSARDSSGDLSSYSYHMADQGTDNFDREFAANLLTSEQDVLYEIDEALRRIDLGTYGICEISGKPIEKERLKALPFARHSVLVQSELERGKPRFRPFKRVSIQQAAETESST